MDNGPMTPFEALLASCQLKIIHGQFNEKNFPLEPPDEVANAEVAIYRQNDQLITGEGLLTKIKSLGYQLCGVRQAMEFIASDPLDTPILVAVIWQNPKNNLAYIPLFYKINGERTVDLFWLKNYVGPFWRILLKTLP